MAWDEYTVHPVSGQNVLRCQLQPSPPEIDARPELAQGTWECGNPAGHQGWANVEGDRDLRDFKAHSWSQTGD
jgi:hypothetical protein